MTTPWSASAIDKVPGNKLQGLVRSLLRVRGVPQMPEMTNAHQGEDQGQRPSPYDGWSETAHFLLTQASNLGDRAFSLAKPPLFLLEERL